MSKRFCTYIADSDEAKWDEAIQEWVEVIRFIEEGQSLPHDWNEFVWQYAKDGAEAVSQHDKKVDLWRADIDAGLPEKQTY